MKMKRLLSFALSLVLVLGSASALPSGVFDESTSITASAEVETNGQNYSDYEVKDNGDGTATLVKYVGLDDHVAVPAITSDGKEVTSIGRYAFSSYIGLESITIPSSVTSIAEGAFKECYDLENLIIPESVTSIGAEAFERTVWLDKQIRKNPFVIVNGILVYSNNQSGTVVIPDTVKTIGDYVFGYYLNLTGIVIPKSVTSIGEGAFNGAGLTNVDIPDTVTSIGKYAFKNCSIRSIDIPNSVTKIGDEAFAGSWVQSATIPNSAQELGNKLFYDCINLSKITLQNGLTYIPDEMFTNCNVSTISIPSSVKSIGNGAFAGCSWLENVTLQEGVVTIGDESFMSCGNLTDIMIPKSVTQIGKRAFENHNEYFKIKVYKDSTAEKYAKENGLMYELITESNITRLAGAGRYATAVEISKAGFPDGSDTVVLAYGLNYADALAGVSLAKAKNAPILLTNLKTLPAETLAEIKRLKAKNVIILGGTGAVGKEVEAALNKEGLKTERIAGATRFETATKIAGKMQALNDNKAPEDIFFVYAFNSADALSVSAVAAVKGAPVIYLKTTGDLDDATAAYLKSIKGSVKNAYVIGGEGVISKDMMKKTRNALGVTPLRVFGANRFETCVAVNEKFADVLDGDMLCVATGMDFPDALAGGVYAALNKAPLFLINGKAKTPQLSDEQKTYLKTKAAEKITAFGGTGVVPDNHIADIAKNSI